MCFPYAGGSATFFYALSERLSARFDVVAVQYPGRQDRHREPCLTEITELSDGIASALPEELGAPRGPLAFFGHSMGALVAFETARRIEAGSWARPEVLFASGRRAPSRTTDERLHLLPDQELVEEVLHLGGTDLEAADDPELMRLVLPVIRADFRAVETYRPNAGVRVGCPVVAMIGELDNHVTCDEATAWRHHTDGGFELRVLPGGHFYLVDQCDQVAQAVTRQLTP